MSDVYDKFVTQATTSALLPAASLQLVREIAGCIRRADAYFANVRAEAAVAASLLRRADLDAAGLQNLMGELGRMGLASGFLRLAQPRNSDELLPWLIERGIGWNALLEHYEWEVRDSLDVFFGVMLGAVGSIAEDVVGIAELGAKAAREAAQQPAVIARVLASMTPPTSVVLQAVGLHAALQTTFDKGAAEAPRAYLQAVFGVVLPQLSASGALEAIGQQSKQWADEFNRLMMRLEFFKAGIHLGRAVGLVLGLLEAGVGIAKVFPKAARRGAALIGELPQRLRSLGKSADPAKVAALSKELGAMDALVHMGDLAAGAKPPFKIVREDLRAVLKSRGMKETADGGQVLFVPCSG